MKEILPGTKEARIFAKFCHWAGIAMTAYGIGVGAYLIKCGESVRQINEIYDQVGKDQSIMSSQDNIRKFYKI